jgi:RNA polymerase sigma-70 factor (ECF subfamily)
MSAAPSAEFVAQITRSQRHLHAFILTLIWHPADADDVLQEANLVLWQKAAEFDAARPFLPWAMRICQLQAMAWLKTRARTKQRLDDALLDTIAAEAMAESDELEPRQRALSDCLQRLSDDHRDLIAKRYEPDGCVNDLAAARGSTPNAVSEQLRRIRATLLTCVERKTGTLPAGGGA